MQVKTGSVRCRHRGRSVRSRAASHAACDKMDKVTAAWLPIMQTTAYYVAIEEKLFEKACIEIDFNKMESPNQIIDALIAERADFGPPGAAAGIAMIAESKFPGKLKIFGLQGGGIAVNRINDGLIVKPDSYHQGLCRPQGKDTGSCAGHPVADDLAPYGACGRPRSGQGCEACRSGGRDAGARGRRRDVDATLSLEPVGSIAVASGKAIRAMTNPVAGVIADPFYSGASIMTTKFLRDRRDVAKRVVAVIDEATDLVNANFAKYKAAIPNYTPIKPDQLELLAQPYLRGFKDLNDTDIKSYQALVDIFIKEGVLTGPLNVRDKLLTRAELGM